MIATDLDDPPRLRLRVRVQPRASKDRIHGIHGDALRIQLTAPPVDGAANAALIEFLAAHLDLPRSAVRLVSGAHGRTKLLEITADPARVRSLLGLPAADP